MYARLSIASLLFIFFKAVELEHLCEILDEKQKELAMARARVDILTRELEQQKRTHTPPAIQDRDMRRSLSSQGSIKLADKNYANYMQELGKLRKELKVLLD